MKAIKRTNTLAKLAGASLMAILAFGVIKASAGPITFVDYSYGTGGNTYETGSTMDDTSWVTSNNSPLTNRWADRGNTLQGRSDSPNESPELTAEVTGLADGKYYAWVFYGDNGSNIWGVSAGLESGSLTEYTRNSLGAVVGTNLNFTNESGAPDGSNHYGLNLGEVTISAGSPKLEVFVGPISSDRTWYKGIGYEAVPEPSSFALIAGVLGLTSVMLRRRRS